MISRALSTFILFLALTGCAGTPFSWDNARQIQPGMTVEEVTAIMGPPLMVSASSAGIIYTWSYAAAFSGSRAMSIVFIDNKVAKSPTIPASF